MSWIETRGRIGGVLRQHPDADVSALRAQLRYEHAEHRVRQIIAPLTPDESLRMLNALAAEQDRQCQDT